MRVLLLSPRENLLCKSDGCVRTLCALTSAHPYVRSYYSTADNILEPSGAIGAPLPGSTALRDALRKKLDELLGWPL